MVAKKSIQDPLTSDDDDNEDDLVCAMTAKEFDQVHQEIMNEIAIQHPIIYGSYNTCLMTRTSKISKFSIAMLQDIRKEVEINASAMKKPYIDLFQDLGTSCTCRV